ncbi:pyridoxal-phosphate dependent enzyme [Thermoflexus sp.]|uniref:pyridoxal-phosphate dependent enzyme n=1 Tax=Thermoflexus sp. TaxID=1969742 RepID=UPI0035E436AA
MGLPSGAPSLAQILEAHWTLRKVLPATPLWMFPVLNRMLGGQVGLKLEAWQPTGSFKVRGALARLAHLTPEERERGVVTASAGNHSLAVAFAAQLLGGDPRYGLPTGNRFPEQDPGPGSNGSLPAAGRSELHGSP